MAALISWREELERDATFVFRIWLIFISVRAGPTIIERPQKALKWSLGTHGPRVGGAEWGRYARLSLTQTCAGH